MCVFFFFFRPLVSLLAFLSEVTQLPQFLFTVVDFHPQGGAFLRHASQQPLQLFDALVLSLTGFLCGLQFVLLVTQTLLQPGAFSLEVRKFGLFNNALQFKHVFNLTVSESEIWCKKLGSS